jgi:hypothetical protein
MKATIKAEEMIITLVFKKNATLSQKKNWRQSPKVVVKTLAPWW